MSIVFREREKSGAFTGNTQQFCSQDCAIEWADQGLAFSLYAEQQEQNPSTRDQCCACLAYLQPLPAADDRYVVNIRIVGHLGRDQDPADTVGLADRIQQEVAAAIAEGAWKIIDLHLPGTAEAEQQIREVAV